MRTLIRFMGLVLSGWMSLASAHFHPAYSHRHDITYSAPQWMGGLDNTLRISDISLPGTHDTMSFFGGDIVQTQSLRLAQQLNAGIRVLDLRLRAVNNRFLLYHGPVYQHASFDEVLTTIVGFLQRQPTETIFARIKEERPPSHCTLTFNQIFNRYIQSQQATIAIPHSDNPSLATLRGKLVFLQNFPGPRYGLNYQRFTIQDDYQMTTNWDLYRKWEKVKAHYRQAAARKEAATYINYLSAAGGAFPYFVASGHVSPSSYAPRLATGLTTLNGKNQWLDFPRVNCMIGLCTVAFEGTNVLSYDYIRRVAPRYVGMVMADFPGPGLIDAIIQVNFQPGQKGQEDVESVKAMTAPTSR